MTNITKKWIPLTTLDTKNESDSHHIILQTHKKKSVIQLTVAEQSVSSN